MPTVNTWIDLAIHLADCQAATAIHIGMLKSAPASHKRRHALICKEAIYHINALAKANNVTLTSHQNKVIERCQSAIDDITQQVGSIHQG